MQVVTISRLTKGNCQTLVELLSCREVDVLTLTCHVLQLCVSSAHGNAVRQFLHEVGFVSALCQLRFPPSLLLHVNTHSRSLLFDGSGSGSRSSSPLLSPSLPSSPLASTLKAKIQRCQASLLQRNLAIIVLVCQRHRLLRMDPTLLAFALDSEIAPAALVSLRVMVSRCGNSHARPRDVADLLKWGVPKIGSLLRTSILAAEDAAVAAANSSSAPPSSAAAKATRQQHRLPALARKTRFTAVAVLVSLISSADRQQKTGYCGAGTCRLHTLVAAQRDCVSSFVCASMKARARDAFARAARLTHTHVACVASRRWLGQKM